MDTLKKCRMCLESLKDPKQLPCFHSFCSSCLEDYGYRFQADECLHCPVCSKKFVIENDFLSSLKNDKFMSRILKNETTPEKSLCGTHPNVEINFFCVDCETMGCPVCSTGTHDQHNCIDLQEMAHVVKEEMKSMSNDLDRTVSWMEKEVETELKTRKNVLEELDATSREIKEKAEFVKVVIDRQMEDLIKQVNQVKNRSAKNMESFNRTSKKMINDIVGYFKSYVNLLVEHGTAEELIESVREVKVQTDDLKKLTITGKDKELTVAHFIPSNLHIDTISLLGHIELKQKLSETTKHNPRNVENNSNPLTNNNNKKEAMTYNSDGEVNKEECVMLRSIPEIEWKKYVLVSEEVAAVAVGRNEFFVAVEHSGDVLRFDCKTLEEKKSCKIIVPDLNSPWDMTSIISDKLSHTYVFVLDNLHGKIYQINVPDNPSIQPDKYITNVWLTPLNETISLSSYNDHLIIAGVTNKILEYSLSSILITSSSSSSSDLIFPDPISSFSVIPHIRDVMHCTRVDDYCYVALFDHLYDLCGAFLVNEWGKMVESFGEGRGYVDHLQLDYPTHVVVDRKEGEVLVGEERGCAVSGTTSPLAAASVPYNDVAFIFICDGNNDRISLFDGNLKFLKIFASEIPDPWRLGLDVKNKLLYVVTISRDVCVIRYH